MSKKPSVRKYQPRIDLRKEAIRKEIKKYRGPRSPGSAIENRMERQRKKLEQKRSRTFKRGGGRANLLEEMGRIDARRHPDAADRAEKRRVIGELNRGYKKGGLIKGKPKLAKKGWN